MSPDPTDPLQASRRENQVLRERVAELERLLHRFGSEAAPDQGLGATLAERQALLSEAERIAHMGSWVWNVISDEVYWSDELFRILGYDTQTDTASSEAFFARVHPDDRARVQETAGRGITSGVSEQVDYRVLRPDGTIRHVSMAGALLFDAEGKLRRAVGTVLDVTEAREAARELERTAELLAEAQRIGRMASFEHDVRSQSVTWSEEMYRILDYERDVQPAIERFIERVHPEDREGTQHWLSRVLETGVVSSKRTRLMHRDGKVRHVDIGTGALRSEEDGSLLALRGTIADITDLVELEAQFHQSQKMEAIGQLAGGLAHDYNNLLTVILANAEFLLVQHEHAELREIVDAATTATSLTDRLLTFTRQPQNRARVVPLSRDIEQSFSLLKRALGERVRIEVQLAPDLPPVRVDSGQIQQVLLNLALNARDAMPRGGTFRLSTSVEQLRTSAARQGAPTGEYVVLRVEDTGAGMDEATRARAFDPFFTTKPPGQGTGLGLAMVFGAARQAGGFVEVESELGKGTVFRLWFPSARVESVPVEEDPEIATAGTASLLLVEDNAAVTKVLLTLLEEAGYSVRVATDPIHALALWCECPADVLVSDVVMPHMSGIALREEIQRITPGVKTLYVTGYSPERLDLQPEQGKSAVVMKPFGKRELLTALARLIAGA